MTKALVLASGFAVLLGGAAFANPIHLLDVSGSTEIAMSVMSETQYQALPDGDGPEELSAVPLPAAGWMLLAGVAGIAAMRRRAKV